MKRDEAIETLVFDLRTRVELLRQKSGMTQDQLAERAGWSQSTLSKFLRGETMPGIDKLLGLQYAFELSSLDELFAPLPDPRSGLVLAAARTDDDDD